MQIEDRQLLWPLTQMLSKLMKAFLAWLPPAFPKSGSYLCSCQPSSPSVSPKPAPVVSK